MTLYLQELRRLCCRKRFLCIMVLLMLCCLMFSYLSMQQSQRYIQDGHIIQGKEAIMLLTKERAKTAGLLSDELLQDYLTKLHQIQKAAPLSSDEEINRLSERDLLPYQPITSFLLKLLEDKQHDFRSANHMLYHFPIKQPLEHFWKQRVRKAYADISKAKQTALEDRLAKKTFPLVFEAQSSEHVILYKLQDVMLVLYIAMIILLATVFTKDRMTRADQVIATSRLGRKQLNKARLYAAISVAVVLFLAAITLYMLPLFLQLGIGQGATSIQLELDAFSPYNLTMKQALISVLVMAFLVYLCLCFLVLCVSQYVKKAYHVILLFFIFIFLSYLLTSSADPSSFLYFLPFGAFDHHLLFQFRPLICASQAIPLPVIAGGSMLMLSVLCAWSIQKRA